MAVSVERTRLLRGANWFAEVPVVVAAIQGQFDPSTWPEVTAALGTLLPQGLRPAFGGTPPETIGEAAERIAGEICAWGGFPPTPFAERNGKARPDAGALPIELAPLAEAAFAMAADLLSAVQDGRARTWPTDARRQLMGFRKIADAYLPASRRYVARAAMARGISWRTLSTAQSTIVVGEGRFARRFDGACTARTSAMAMRAAGNKRAANQALARAGVPVARQMRVPSLADAENAIRRMGLPIVIKPGSGRRQQGVSFVFQRGHLESAYARSVAATESDTELLAESWLPGKEYRVLVIDGEIASAVESDQAQVVGDGRTSIEGLIAAANADGRRGPRELGYVQCHIPLDDLAVHFLAHQGFSPHDVPEAGRTLVVHPLPMMRFGGGFKREVGDTIHAETREMLLRAALVLDLDVAGIDLRTPDIGRSWREVGAGICEVNPQPSLTVHYNVLGAGKRDVAGILLDRCYPAAVRGRMTHVIVATDGDRGETARRLVDALAATGRRVALVDTHGADLAGYRSRLSTRTWQDAQGLAIEDPTLDSAVHVTTVTSLVRGGLGVMQADVLLVEPMLETSGLEVQLALLSARRAGARVMRMPPSDDDLVRGVLEMLGSASAAPGRR